MAETLLGSPDEVRPVFCNQCGAKNDDVARFCSSCGAPLSGQTPSTEPTSPQPRATNPALPWIIASAVLAALVLGGLIWVLAWFVPAQVHQPIAPAGVSSPGGTSAAESETPGGGPAGTTTQPAEDLKPEPSPQPEVPPEPSEDPVAQATVVLERYLAADLGNDGEEMAKYLGGSAAAQFRPEVVGQEDLTVHSKIVTGHTVVGPNQINFEVTVKWSPSDSDEVKTDLEDYVLKRTDRGWKITSTPAYH
ncbi:MAG: zinc-ribbon domain-containing protein [Armatimonadia bacterium]